MAQHLTTRPTQDLDFFTRVGGTGVPAARDAFEAAAHGRGWTIEMIRDEATFCRLVVHGNRGFDRHILAEMLRGLARFRDADLPAREAHIASHR